MKHALFLITIILVFTQSALAIQTYYYTFTSNPFSPTITSTTQSVNLNGRTIYTKIDANSPAVCQFIPGRGLRITNSSTFHLIIYTKTSNPTLSASISLETNHNISLIFDRPNQSTPSTEYTATSGISTITHNYTNNTLGPKISITIGIKDTIYIRSLEFVFDVTSSAHTINLYDASSQLINSFPADSLPITLPSFIQEDPRFSFIGWTTQSFSNSSTQPTDLTTTLSSAPSADINLHPVLVHNLPDSAPVYETLDASSSTALSITKHLTLPNNAFLASLYVHIVGNSSTETTKYSISSNEINITNTILYTYTNKTRFHEFEVNTHITPADTITLSISRTGTALTVDSVVAIYYPQTTHRYYSSIPTFTTSNNLTIDFPRSVTSGDTLTAIDALTYSMTTDDSLYYFFSLPFPVPFNNITIEPLSGPHPRTYYSGYDEDNDQYIGDFVISDYDEVSRSWRDLELSDLQNTGLLANHGYTFGLTKSNTQATINFRTSNAAPASPYTITTSQPATTLPTPLTNPSDTRNSGWHLIGNPYLTPLSPSSIYTSTNQHLNYVLIPNTTNTSYTILSPYSEHPTTSIPPFTSFFIQALTDSTLINPNNQSSIINHQSSTIYHFNIVCQTPDSIISTLTILSSPQFTDSYEPGYDLKSLSPSTDITHDGLAIYASNISTGDTISISTPDNASLSLGRNILIPDHWSISIEDNQIIISDNTPASTPDISEETPTDDPVISIHTISGHQIPLTSSLSPGIYILRHLSGRTSKTLIK